MADKPMGFIPRAMLERKPRHGDPCNRCGACCAIVLCQLGKHLFKREQGPCPALKPDGNDEYVCDVVRNPQAYAQRLSPEIKIHALRDAALKILYADSGCDARFNGEWINEKYHAECAVRDAKDKPKRDAAVKLWGIKE